MTDVNIVRVFPLTPEGGNPAPIVLNAEGMTGENMRCIAAESGHESGFVLPASLNSGCDYKFRFFVPRHEMEMCGHATIGALWMLRHMGKLECENISIETLSGIVKAHVPTKGPIAISQPKGSVTLVEGNAVKSLLEVLKLEPSDLVTSSILNVSTSRVKTLIALKDRQMLDDLSPNYSRMESICGEIGSTGLYPFVSGAEGGLFHARQFPAASGYPEDAATGIAASALAYGVIEMGLASRQQTIIIRQGEVMGCPSQITINFAKNEADGCWINGSCLLDADVSLSSQTEIQE